MHHFPFHVRDFSHSTARCELVEIGLYVRLMMEYYADEAALTDDVEELAYKVGARTQPEKKSLARVLDRFFDHDAVRKCFVQARCEAVIMDYRKSGVQSRYANLGRHWEKVNPGVERPSYDVFVVNPDSWFEEGTGRVRKVTGRNSLVLVSESPDSPALPLPQSQPETNNQEPITSTPIVPKGTALMGDVAEAVYELYPKKVGKVKAIAAIVKVLKSGTITELDLQARVKGYAEATAMWAEQDKTYIPYPATWFNQQRYLDDPATWTRQPSLAEKKERGGGGQPQPEMAAAVTELPVAPEGWEDAMPELYGPGWREHYGAFEMMLPADQRQVRAWLLANRGQAAQATRCCVNNELGN